MDEKKKKKLFEDYKEAKDYFLYYLKPNYDKYYKMFSCYTGDRAEDLEKINGKDMKTWQSNVFIPLIFSYVKQFLQKTVGVCPDYTIKGTNANTLKEAIDVIWKYRMAEKQIDYFLQTFIYGWTVGKDYLTEEDENSFESSMIEEIDEETGETIEKLKRDRKVKKKVYWPDFNSPSIYSIFFNPRAKDFKNKNMTKFERFVLNYDEILEQYPDLPKSAKDKLLDDEGNPKTMGDVSDYEYVKKQVMGQVIESVRNTTKNNTPTSAGSGYSYNQEKPVSEPLYEIVEAETKGGDIVIFIPGENIILHEKVNPYDHGESKYTKVAFFPKPYSIDGMGIAEVVKGIQELLNGDVNKISDALAIRLNGMLIASPTALPGYDQQKNFVFKPTGILWTNDPNGIRKLEFGDVNSGSFLQADKLKEYARQAIGLDEYSVLSPEKKQTATVASFMREATIEGVKLFLFMLKNSYVTHFGHFISMAKQFWTERRFVPNEVLAAIDDNADINFPVKDEEWIDENGEHKLWPGRYEIDVDQASTLASSTELRRANDKNLWEMVKDLPDEMPDPETGEIISIKKWKILMKILEDSSGWDSEQYVSKRKAEEGITNMNPLGAETLQEDKSKVEIPTEEVAGAAGLTKPTALFPKI